MNICFLKYSFTVVTNMRLSWEGVSGDCNTCCFGTPLLADFSLAVSWIEFNSIMFTIFVLF